MAGGKDEGARPEGWTEEEKTRGAPETSNPDAAGTATPAAKTSDDRAATESAAARIEQDAERARSDGKG